MKTTINERFFRQAIELFKKNECTPGDIIDAFHGCVIKTGITPVLTTRPEGFKTAILVVVDDQRSMDSHSKKD